MTEHDTRKIMPLRHRSATAIVTTAVTNLTLAFNPRTLAFGSPYADDSGTFALSCQSCATANIVVGPTGLGLMGDGGTVQQITVVATQ